MKKRALWIIAILLGLILISGLGWAYETSWEAVGADVPANELGAGDPSEGAKVIALVDNYPEEMPYKRDHRRPKDYAVLQADIEAYLAQQEGHYGVYFVSLKTGKEIGINENDQFFAASTIKVPVSLYLYTQFAEGKQDPNTKLVYTEKFYEAGTGKIQYEEFGQEYSLRTLSKLSIEISDNVAVNMLIAHLGRSKILDYEESLVGHPVNRARNFSTPKDMGVYMQTIVEFEKEYPELGQELIGYLENTVFNDRMPKYLPEDVSVAHKIGTWPDTGSSHDVGIVYAKNPFILSIMSEGVADPNQAAEVIGQITKMVYDFEQR